MEDELKVMEGSVYLFKDEFFPLVGITECCYKNHKERLLDWLKTFYDYELFGERPIYIRINKILGEYKPLPRSRTNLDLLELRKRYDYEKFTIAELGTEFKPNSKMRISRKAIEAFGFEKYNHTNPEAVAKRYIKKPFEEYGETNGNRVWVWYHNYKKLEPEVLENWRNILDEERIGEREAANAFYKQEQGLDISKEKSYYRNAVERFFNEYGDTPVLVSEWRVK